MTTPLPSIAILLSTFNGAPYLAAQLDSLAAQEGVEWRLFWRDDGSHDGSPALMQAFAAASGAGRVMRVDEAGHMGVTASYMALLRAAVAQGSDVVAFSDQDDVWLPGKLARGLEQLRLGRVGAGIGMPVLYCSRQVLVDGALQRICESAPITVAPGLGPALTQNVATGCTVMLDRAAAILVAASTPPPPSLHDWWSYLLVAGAGGRIIADDAATVLYRQHGNNAVGAPRSKRRRALAALQRGPGAFMNVMRAHVAGLQAHRALLSPRGNVMVDAVAAGLAGGVPARIAALRKYELRRQTWAETLLFRCWFLIG